ncbi:MAG TPA: transketolase [Bryobacteraceae bacterium]|nr:transketolase [Bryobacteraceae bacterium]
MAVVSDVIPRIQSGGLQSLEAEARALRLEIVSAFFACGGGHYGGALSVLDIVLALYRTTLRVAPMCPDHPDRDRFILSKGHSAMALYAVLRRLGYFDEPLSRYGRIDSALEGHPDMTVLPGIDFSTGSLGQGLSVGLGMAMALKGTDRHVWVILGDGECQEGQVWESAMLAARLNTNRLHAVIDCNGYQEWGWTQQPGAPPPVPLLREKWEAFGWNTMYVDGHDYGALSTTFRTALAARQPTVILAKTIKGRGFPLIEQDPVRFHCTTVDEGEQAILLGLPK